MKNTALVCEHLENVSRNLLDKYQAIIREYIRHRHGIYALFRKGKLYYVGLATSLSGRLKQHLRDKHRDSWDCFSVYLTIGDTHMKELESLVLRIVKPKGNRQTGRFPRSRNLKSRLNRDVARWQKEEREKLFGLPVSNGRPSGPHDRDGRLPVLAKYIRRFRENRSLRAVHKGKAIKARVRRDGMIVFKGNKYTSPSVAGAVAVRRKSCNGWVFWKWERATGDWVVLNELRR